MTINTKTLSDQETQYDVIVVGAGLSGLAAAVTACELGMSTLVIAKIPAMHSHSVSARGGMNAAIQEKDTASHISDTLASGKNLNDAKRVKFFCDNAPSVITWMEQLGVNFDKTGDQYNVKRFSGNTLPRACYSKGRTGLNCIKALLKKAITLGVVFDEHFFVTEIPFSNNKLSGVVGIDRKTAKVKSYLSSQVILATGGGLNNYRYSSNATSSTSDGIALALGAGAVIKDLEFIQFHPFGLAHNGIQFPEPVISAGAQLFNSSNKRFMLEHDPVAAEQVSRDILSIEIEKQKRLGEQVFIDFSQIELSKRDICKEAEDIAKTYLNADLYEQRFEITPSAHYLIGGISVDENCQVLAEKSPINGLFAIGECASAGIHGANRLGGNSLVETLIYGRHAALNLKRDKLAQLPNVKNNNKSQVSTITQQKVKNILKADFENSNNVNKLKSKLKESMSKHLGVFRNSKGLSDQLAQFDVWINELATYGIKSSSTLFNDEIVEYFELANMLVVSKAITLGALYRKESRGAHYHSEYPNNSTSDAFHSLIFIKNDKMHLSHEFVSSSRRELICYE